MTIAIDTKFVHSKIMQEAQKLIAHAVVAGDELKRKSCRGSEWTGFFDYPRLAGFKVGAEIKTFVSTLTVDYDHVLVLGIGGSFQGTLAVHEALVHGWSRFLPTRRPHLSFSGCHLSEALTIECLDALDRSEPVVVVVSKTGTTIETALSFRIVKNYLEHRFGRAGARQRIVVITDREKGTLRAESNALGYKAFSVPEDIGGRYSVLTPVGLVPLALGGYCIDDLLRGADDFFSLPLDEGHPAVRYAAIRNAAYQQNKLIEVLSCSDPKLRALGDWWRQLFGESEGKEGKGLFPATMILTTDLHSMGQYLQEGKRHLFETFLTVMDLASTDERGIERRLKVSMAHGGPSELESERNKQESVARSGARKRQTEERSDERSEELYFLAGKSIQEINHAAVQGTRVAHYDGGVPNLSLTVPTLNAYTLGHLFAFFQVSCALSSALLGVNPFDQPGVEDYKKNLMALVGKPGLEDRAQQLRARL